MARERLDRYSWRGRAVVAGVVGSVSIFLGWTLRSVEERVTWVFLIVGGILAIAALVSLGLWGRDVARAARDDEP